MQLKRLNSISMYFYILPAILIVAGVMVIPLLYTFYSSVFRVNMLTRTTSFVGFDNFKTIFNDDIFILSIKNTLYWTIGSVLFQFVIGFSLANILNLRRIKLKYIMRVLLMVPWVLPGIISALVWQWMYHSDFGIINHILTSIGVIENSISWTTSASTAMPAAIVINVWKMVPFVILMTEAALQNVPIEQKEAARIDGAGIMKTFFYVTIPNISATINTVILLLLIWTMNAFTFIFILTEGGPAHRTEILSLYIYRTYFRNYNTGHAAAAATVLFTLTAFFALIYNRYVIRRNKGT